MVEITEQELARQESANNTRLQELVDTFQEDYPDTERECKAMVNLLGALGANFAGRVLTTAIIQIHITIGYQTGKGYTRQDCEEGD